VAGAAVDNLLGSGLFFLHSTIVTEVSSVDKQAKNYYSSANETI
jgi:hypothetical protein